MAQGGDPMGTGGGDPGYEFVNEDSDLTFDKPGVLAMANAGRDTNGSQFFITFVPTPQLNGGYTIFGQVISGMDVVNGITRRDPQSFPNYTGDVFFFFTITEVLL
jgi:cyclophilin family peptidyl-prolyl cis-trans isomerase